MSSGRILLVHQDATLRVAMAYILERDGYQVERAERADEVLRRSKRGPALDLVLLHVELADRPGTEVCRMLRGSGSERAPALIILSAEGAEVDRIAGLEVGADDYVTTPFSVRELLLRIRAILRRRRIQGPRVRWLESGTLRLDIQGHTAWLGRERLALTPIEFRLLARLMQEPGRVLRRELLLEQVWGVQARLTTRTVDTHIRRLRAKLGAARGCIETVRSVGYRFCPAQ